MPFLNLSRTLTTIGVCMGVVIYIVERTSHGKGAKVSFVDVPYEWTHRRRGR